MMLRSTSLVSMRASADPRLSEAVVFQLLAVGTPLIVPPVNGSIAHGIRLSFCFERASDTTPVNRLLRNEGNFLANSPFTLKY